MAAAAIAALVWRPGAGRVISATAQPSQDDRDLLLAKARDRGTVPLIIGLAVPPDEAAAPGSTSRPTPPASIAAIQARLLDELGVVRSTDGRLTGPGITNVKLFATIPFLALTADAAVLEFLLSHPLVASVTEDRTTSTQ